MIVLLFCVGLVLGWIVGEAVFSFYLRRRR